MSSLLKKKKERLILWASKSLNTEALLQNYRNINKVDFE